MTYPVAKIHLNTLRAISKRIRPLLGDDEGGRTVVYNEVSRRILIVRQSEECIPGSWWYLFSSRIGTPFEYNGKLIVEGKGNIGRFGARDFEPRVHDDQILNYDGRIYCEIVVVPDTEPESIPEDIQ